MKVPTLIQILHTDACYSHNDGEMPQKEFLSKLSNLQRKAVVLLNLSWCLETSSLEGWIVEECQDGSVEVFKEIEKDFEKLKEIDSREVYSAIRNVMELATKAAHLKYEDLKNHGVGEFLDDLDTKINKFTNFHKEIEEFIYTLAFYENN